MIINRYAADGRKLETEYFTMKLPLVTPIYKDTVYTWTYSSGLVNQTGMIYIDNLEYQITSGMLQSLYLLRMHNPEGYADNVTINPYGPFYYYYHKDHLGNNREVWKAAYSINGTVTPASIVQQTSYYPSGLPWSDGSGVSTQPYKYNGKEFVEMHGLDTYDYGARGYYPAMGRFMTVDPLAEKYYSISPYAYCLNNPVKYLDPDGKEVWLSYTFDDGKTVKAQYKNGGLYNSDGSKYQGGNSYILKTGQQLSQLRNVSKEVNGIVSSLANDDNIHTIANIDTSDPNEEGNSNRSVNIADDGIIKGVTESNNSITKYDPDATETVTGDKRDPKVGLAHELKHDYDRSNGGLRKGTTKNGIKNYEVDAVNVENQVRKKTGDHQRTTYGEKKIPKEDLK